MDALVIGSAGGLPAALEALLRRRGRDVLRATPADVADDARAAWLLAEAVEPSLVVVCEPPPYAACARLAGRGRLVLAADERRVATARFDGGPARSAAARELVRAARAVGGRARVVRLARAGARWVEARPGAPVLGAQAAAAAVLAAPHVRVVA